MTTPATITAEPVYEQEIDGFGTVRLVPVDPARDAALLHGWVTEERAHFWGMGEATVEQVEEIYTHLDSLTTHHGYLVLRDGAPVALFQTYDPEADRVSECYDARPGDFGVHILVGPAGGKGAPAGGATAPERGFTANLLTAVIGFVFADPEHLRIVAEPDARNARAVARLERAGFELGPEIVMPEVDLPEVFLPEKRARLAFLTRSAYEASRPA
ncbi:siderophore biosynthesis protein [Streptomyces agglomeratus]|uniref:Lysine N-acyltransferase MbtK n=1 Tax=Streptomyces agglomeratus TaxID=285458 RepID=A0A1E5PD62_9ACTN|nr:GNAT family N-acetyltransferase [Streptomyces agglomeratus]OEJ27478.1 siderophore biosynthesis protein [Streptomyces agglomeratus]OEJ38465.1 siderophore biosynthesis protein [Streptomyces agglomeratus]OEJ47150.1 siderophore biosynthesis protein [Streptomyces agglomeratus]OEJ50993.1 siderophore biosynthesis protein [Streptomyces agglomeratus]OEJ58363.1 siderophore biosynthesis protein [Streptomyces agglomeratus]